MRGLLDGSTRAGGYDVKKLVHIFHSAGIDGARFSDDAMIAAHLLDPARGFADVEDAASQFLGLGLPGDAAAAADAAFRLIAKARIELERRGQLRLYEELELPLAPVLASMEEAGIAIDSDELRVVGDRVDTAAEQLRKHIFDFAGEEFNIGSPQQLGKVLFGKLNIPGGKKTKTGFATGVEVLQGLARDYPICALVLEWREVTKLKNTYVDVIPQLVDAKGRAPAHRVQPNRDGDGPPLVHQPQSAKHSGARRAWTPDSPRLRRKERRLRFARRGLQPDRASCDGASFGRRSDATGLCAVAGHSRLHRAPNLRHRTRRAGRS